MFVFQTTFIFYFINLFWEECKIYKFTIDTDEKGNLICVTKYGGKYPVEFSDKAKEKIHKSIHRKDLLEKIKEHYLNNYDPVKDVWLNELDFNKIADMIETYGRNSVNEFIYSPKDNPFRKECFENYFKKIGFDKKKK